MSRFYTEDDLLDYEDYEEWDDYDEPPAAKPKKPAQPKKTPQQGCSEAGSSNGVHSRSSRRNAGATAPAESAGASSLARYLCDPPPTRPDGKKQKGGIRKVTNDGGTQMFPISPVHEGTLDSFKFDVPSPDDMVQAARSRAAASQHGSSTSDTQPIVEQLDNVSLETPNSLTDAPETVQAPTRKSLSDFILEPELARLCESETALELESGGRLKLHLAVLGHVDAGKSTLMGRLLYDLGAIGQKEIHKNEKAAAEMGKASFSWAWTFDERPEERERGITVDIGMSRFQTSKYQVTVLDAPGHRDFVPNMISGAAQADAALLVVDGSVSGFEAGFQDASNIDCGGQTREHVQLAKTLGIDQIAVVVTKLDTCGFSKDRFDEIHDQLLPFLLKTGFREKSIQWLPASAPNGLNMLRPPGEEPQLAQWWNGKTLLKAVDSFTPISRNFLVPLRVPISDTFKTRSLGQIAVGGKVEGGALKVGGEVLVMPSGNLATIKALEVDGKEAKIGRAGDSCDIGLTGIDPGNLFPGAVLCTPGWPVCVTRSIQLRVLVLDPRVPIIPGLQVVLHAHTAEEEGAVKKLLHTLNPKTGEVLRNKPRCLVKGQTAVIEVTSSQGICVEKYSAYRALGRVVLRETGRTVAVGIVTELSE